MDYAVAASKFAQARSADKGKPIANNTRIVRVLDGPDPSYAIRLHQTNVVVFHPSGAISLNTGGWPTTTTCDRMGYAWPRIHVWRERETIIACTEGRWNKDTAVVVDTRAFLSANGEWTDHADTYESHLDRWAEDDREKARYRRECQRAAILERALAPHDRWGWYSISAGHLRLANGVLYSGENPVAVIYPATVADERMRALTVVSQRALKRTRIAMELVERANEAGHVIDFADHATVVTESQNRTGALA